MRRINRLLLCFCLSGLPVAAGAQGNDSLTFHPRQWAAEFAIGNEFGSLGFLRFQTPLRALMLDVSGSVGTESGANTNRTHDANGTLRIGMRWYKPVARAVSRFVSLGALGLGNRVRFENDTEVLQRSSAVGVGSFANVGALWMISPHLSLGATWEANLTYVRSTDQPTQGQETRRTRTTLSGGAVRLRGNLYF